jgi:hypothetical protein
VSVIKKRMRRKREPGTGEVAVFQPVIASPEGEADYEDLQKYKFSKDEPYNYQVLFLRRLRWLAEEGKRRDRKLH